MAAQYNTRLDNCLVKKQAAYSRLFLINEISY